MITAVILFVLGSIFGSFVTALTWRIHEHKDWVRGRSQCVHCGHRLGARDLVPIFSWLTLGGKCRYCKAPISVQYPLTELGLGLVFAFSYYFWPYSLVANIDKAYFGTWLAGSIGLMALLIYDMKWMLLPTRIIYPTLVVIVVGNLSFLSAAGNKRLFIVNWLASVLVASGIFFILHVISAGKWIGFGDVRLGLVTGTALHKPGLSFLMIFLASLLGTAFVLPSLMTRKRKIDVRLPYGPFLIVATFICLLFGQPLLNWYINLVSI